jgi:hypothetical protein
VARLAARLRAAGWRVRMSAAGDAAVLQAEAREAGAAAWVLAADGVARSTSDGAAISLDPVPPAPTLPLREGGLDG